MEGDVEIQQKIIHNLTFQKSQLEHEVYQYSTKLDLAMKDKAASEQELSHTKLLIEQAEVKWSLAQTELKDLLQKTSHGQDSEESKFRPNVHIQDGAENQLQFQIHAQENTLPQQPLSFDSHPAANSESKSSSCRPNDNRMIADVLQQKLEELVLVQKRAEMAEDKAQNYKKLLDDSNYRLKNLQMDMECERNNMKQKAEDLQQEALIIKKSINKFQEQIRTLQRAKSSLEQNAFFQNTEVEGLKEQLKMTQGELQKKDSMEQENIRKVSILEEELSSKQALIDQLRSECNKLTRINVSSDNNINGLQIQTELLQKERSFSEQNIKSLKSEIEYLKQQLQTAKEENDLLKSAELAWKFKCKNLEAELQTSDLNASQLQKKTDDLKEVNVEMEDFLKTARTKLDQVMIEIDSKDQQIEIFKSQAESTKSQVRIIEEELNKKSQTLHELQMKLQDCSEELKEMNQLQQKTAALNSRTTSSEKELTALRSELKSVFVERNSAIQKIQMQNAEINNLNMLLKEKLAELQKESTESQKHLKNLKSLEEELFKHKYSIKGLTNSSETITESLKQEICALQNEKKASQRNIENLNIKLSELSFSFQRTKDELQKEIKERELRELKILELETELQKNKVTAREVLSNADHSQSNLQHENMILKREKAEELQKSISLGFEIRTLKEKLQHAQTEAEQKQTENSVLQLKSQQMEEQLEKCKRMLEDLKGKLQLQKEGYERQLLLVQTEIEKKLITLQSEISIESKKSVQSVELEEMLNRYFNQDVGQTKTVSQTTVEKKQQMDQQQLQIKLDKLEREKTKLGHDLSMAKLQIAQLEEDKLKLSTDSERKLMLKDNETRALQEQLESHMKEVKSLQERLVTLAVGMGMNKQEVTETTHQRMKDNEAALFDVQPTLMQKMVLQKQVIQDQMEVNRSLQDSPAKKALKSFTHQTPTEEVTPKVTSERQIKNDKPITLTTRGYMSLCELTDMQRIPKARTFMKNEICEAVDTPEETNTQSERKLNETYSTSLKHPEKKDSTSIQKVIKFKFLDEAVLHQAEMGQEEEVLALATHCFSKPTAIAGLYMESSRKKISFLEAADKGFLAKTYALDFLEAQAATGSLTDIATGQIHSVKEAVEKGIIEASLKDKLIDAQKAVGGYIHKGKKLSVFQAMQQRIIDRYKGKKILEVQVATGGLIEPENGVRVPTSLAVDRGLLDKETLQSLHDPVSNPKGFHNPDTGQRAYYSEIKKTCLFDVDGGVFLLPLGERHLTSTSPTSSHRMSVVISSCGIEMSAYEAFKGRHIDEKMYLFLSQQESDWQEKCMADASGNPLHIITDVRSGRQLCLESALNQGCLEMSELDSYRSGALSLHEIADIVFSRMVVVDDVNSPIAGFWDITQRKRLSVLQGFQQAFTDSDTALRLLEAQACTGGICDPSSGEKLTLSAAFKRGLVDAALNQQLQVFEEAFNGFVHPKTSKTLSVSQAVQENLFSRDAGYRCMEFQLLTGGLISPDTHERVSLEEALQNGLVDKVTASLLKDEKLHTKSLTCPKTKRRITFREALERSMYDCHTGLRLLEATKVPAYGAKSTFHYVWAFKQ